MICWSCSSIVVFQKRIKNTQRWRLLLLLLFPEKSNQIIKTCFARKLIWIYVFFASGMFRYFSSPRKKKLIRSINNFFNNTFQINFDSIQILFLLHLCNKPCKAMLYIAIYHPVCYRNENCFDKFQDWEKHLIFVDMPRIVNVPFVPNMPKLYLKDVI
jgi:hypothetical protein